MEQFNQVKATLDRELSRFPVAVELEKRSGVPKAYMAAGGAGVLTLMIFFNIAGQLLTNMVGFLYPAYASFRSIESPGKTDDTQWLTYWVVYAFFSIIEYFADILIYWLPMYYTIKAAFLLWLYLPYFRGADRVYSGTIRPFLLANESKIDAGIAAAKKAAATVAGDALKKD
ncbi:ER membrane protein DP1/Yop1 [Blastocladiella emersonii ATCC 22665]|nr:ER membrane protein DP1/Yop1 [Blastocladiella emersonii ATCC 22665]